MRTRVKVALAAVAAAVAARVGFGSSGGASGRASDATAAGVAKIRHIETTWPVEGGEQRLFSDPYASHFYPGSSIIPWFPIKLFMRWAISDLNAGLMWLLTGRTREFDEQVLAAVRDGGVTQVVILGAGYDTRGFRLGLPGNVRVFEVDQPDVQEKKRAALSRIAELPNTQNVHFVPIDFNTEALDKLRGAPHYDASAPTIFTMEGVSQYIPKEATAGTLKAAAALCGPGSRLIISYVPQDIWDAPERVADPDGLKAMLTKVAGVGEPWISGWHKADFAAFMRENGFEVQHDVSIGELVEQYYAAASRHVPENQRVALERYAWGRKL